MSDELERVNQMWPVALKARVKEVAGQRGITEFTIAAVQQHLGVAPSFDDLTVGLNRSKEMVQLLADKLVLGGDSQDRLQSLVEIEWPEWVDTTGWPSAYASMVGERRAAAEPVAPPPLERTDEDGTVYVDESQITRVSRTPKPVEPEVQLPTEPAAPLAVQADVPTPVVQTEDLGNRDDLFARVMKRTGQDLSHVPGLMPASDLHNHSWERTDGVLCCECGSWIDDTDPDHPNGIVRSEGWAPETSEAVPDEVAPSGPAASEPAMCPKGHGELIDGECWSCP